MTKPPEYRPEQVEALIGPLERTIKTAIDSWQESLAAHHIEAWREHTGQRPAIWFHDRVAPILCDAINALATLLPGQRKENDMIKVHHTHGLTEQFATLAEAWQRLVAVYGSEIVAVGPSGHAVDGDSDIEDITDGRALVWPDAAASENDDGARTVASITMWRAEHGCR